MKSLLKLLLIASLTVFSGRLSAQDTAKHCFTHAEIIEANKLLARGAACDTLLKLAEQDNTDLLEAAKGLQEQVDNRQAKIKELNRMYDRAAAERDTYMTKSMKLEKKVKRTRVLALCAIIPAVAYIVVKK